MDEATASDSDIKRWRFTGAQVQAQLRAGSRVLGIENPCLPEDEAQEMVLGVSIFNFNSFIKGLS